MPEKLKDKIFTGIISLIVSVLVVFITFTGRAWSNKATKEDVNIVETKLLEEINDTNEDIEELEDMLKQHIVDDKDFRKELKKDLNKHQDQIIEIIKNDKN